MTAACKRGLVAVLLVLAIAGPATAQTPTPSTPPTNAADEAFKAGRELYKAGKYAEACAQFDKSHRLDPAYGTLFNIAQCSERIGKLATAAAAYREVAAKDGNDQRKAAAAERLKEVTPRVSRLFVKVQNPPSGLVVELDTKSGPRSIAANKAVEVDFGEYTVIARARGYNEFMSRVKIHQEAKTVTVEAMLKSGASNADAIGVVSEEEEKPETPTQPRSRRKLIAIGVMATGGAAVIGGVVFGSLARSTWNDAKAVCGGMTCTTQEDLARANDLGDQARSKATLSTVFTLAGVALIGGGVALWITAPKDTQITPTASDSGAGVSISGHF